MTAPSQSLADRLYAEYDRSTVNTAVNQINSAALNAAVVIDLGHLINAGCFAIRFPGTASSGTVVFEGSVDGTNWFPVRMSVSSTGTFATSVDGTTGAALWYLVDAPVRMLRFRNSVAIVGAVTAIDYAVERY